MIYIIDEKEIRQSNYGWDNNRLKNNREILKAIHSAEEWMEVNTEDLYSGENVILFHDSFFDDPRNKNLERSEGLKKKLKNKSNNARTVFFGGSYSGRNIQSENYASMHVSWVYKNLAFFIEMVKKGDTNLRYLAFGKRYKYEQIANKRSMIWRYLYTKDNTQEKFHLPPKIREQLMDIVSISGKEISDQDFEKSPQTVQYFKYLINNLIKETFDD